MVPKCSGKKKSCLMYHLEKCLCHSTLTYAEREKNHEDDFFLTSFIYENLLASQFCGRVSAKNNCEKPPWIVMFGDDCHITYTLQAVFLHTLLRVLDKGKLSYCLLSNFTHSHDINL